MFQLEQHVLGFKWKYIIVDLDLNAMKYFELWLDACVIAMMFYKSITFVSTNPHGIFLKYITSLHIQLWINDVIRIMFWLQHVMWQHTIIIKLYTWNACKIFSTQNVTLS